MDQRGKACVAANKGLNASVRLVQENERAAARFESRVLNGWLPVRITTLLLGRRDTGHRRRECDKDSQASRCRPRAQAHDGPEQEA